MVASTLKTILSVAGGGSIDFLAAWVADATARTLRMRITLDSTVVYDFISASAATVSNGAVFIGGGNNNASNIANPQPLAFNTSLLVEMASSLTETDKFSIGYRYITY